MSAVIPLGEIERLCAEAQADGYETGRRISYPLQRPMSGGPDPRGQFQLRVTPETVAALTRAVRAAQAFEADLSEFCDGPARDELRAALAPFAASPPAPLTKEQR